MHVYGILQSMWRTAGSRNLCGICGRGSTTHTAYTAGVPQFMRYIRPGLRNLYYATIYPFRNIQSSVRYISAQCRIADTEAYRHKLVSFSFPQSSHYIKKAQGCAEGHGLVPLCGFLTFQCNLPSAGGRSLCAIQPKAAAYAAYTADVPQSIRHIQPEFRNLCGIYGGVSAIYIMQQYILQKYTKFRLIHFGSVSNYRYRSIQAQVSFFPHSTIAALYKKGPGVCRGARPCAPLRFSYIPM